MVKILPICGNEWSVATHIKMESHERKVVVVKSGVVPAYLEFYSYKVEK